MATTGDPKAMHASASRRSGYRRWRWTVDQYQELIELGFLEGRRVELLDGEILEMAAHKPAHANAIEKLDDALRAAFGPEYRVRMQLPLDVGRRSQPEPDGAVLFRRAEPGGDHPRDPVLVVEVSDTSLREDRTIKAHLYAGAGIADYWIVNLVNRRLEIHRNPGPDPAHKGRFRYADVTIVPADGHAAPLAKPEARIAVADLLP